jgi:hypothetical protein
MIPCWKKFELITSGQALARLVLIHFNVVVVVVAVAAATR